MRQAILCNAIKRALARPQARWELVAFDAHIEREMVEWMLKESAAIGQAGGK